MSCYYFAKTEFGAGTKFGADSCVENLSPRVNKITETVGLFIAKSMVIIALKFRQLMMMV